MNNLSLELKAREIKNPQTREYFQEVYGCYSQSYYRSAIVMLWSVIVTDLLLKLEDLINSEDQANYQHIKQSIDELRTNNEKSSEWELKLVELMGKHSELLDNADVTNLQFLQKHRHLSAHPVITNDEVLFAPNQDQVRGHMMAALDSILTKPALMGRKILSSFLSSIANFESNTSPNQEDLERFITSRYLDKISDNATYKLFIDLWKFVFVKKDQLSTQHRGLNALALVIIYQSKQSLIEYRLEAEGRHDLLVESFDDKGCTFSVGSVFFRAPQLYQRVSVDSKAILTSSAKMSKRQALVSAFLYTDVKDYFSNFKNASGDLNESVYRDLIKAVNSYFKQDDLLIRCSIDHFSESTSFGIADQRWNHLLSDLIPRFTDEHIFYFCERVMNGHESFGGYVQCLGCGRATSAVCDLVLEREITLPNRCKPFAEQFKDNLTPSSGEDETASAEQEDDKIAF